MAEALAALALVGRDELAGPPPLLVVHGAAFVAQRAAGVVAALALVVLKDVPVKLKPEFLNTFL